MNSYLFDVVNDYQNHPIVIYNSEGIIKQVNTSFVNTFEINNYTNILEFIRSEDKENFSYNWFNCSINNSNKSGVLKLENKLSIDNFYYLGNLIDKSNTVQEWICNFIPMNYMSSLYASYDEIIEKKNLELEFFAKEKEEILKNLSEDSIRMIDQTEKLINYNKLLVESEIKYKQSILEKDELLKTLENTSKQIYEESLKILELNNKLSESEQQLLESNKAKDKFFSIIAHDLRNPLAGLTGLLELIKSDLLDMSINEIANTTNQLHSAAVALSDLLENLLEWSRMQRNVVSFDSDKIQVAQIVDNILELASLNAIKKNIELKNHINNNVWVFADPSMLNTIIRNLVFNAIKFTPINGKVEVEIYEHDSNFMRIAVIDNGVGMSQSAIDKLFRIDSTRSTLGTNKEEGTGLGLILCHELVLKHGGNIWVESEIKVGSAFYFTIPKVHTI